MSIVISMWSCPCEFDGVIDALKIHQFRNISTLSLSLTECNVLIGQNGSGKTSLLEAVFLLSRGKSFRHHEPKRYIAHSKSSCAIWASTLHHTLAIQKNLDPKGFASTVLRLDDATVKAQGVLSYALPVCLIDPSGMALLEEGSHARRQLLDWAVFHVKPDFYEAWLSYQRLLKQRNLLLKSPSIHQRLSELGAWDYQLSIHAQRLHEQRQAVFDEWQGYFKTLLGRFLPHYQHSISLHYQAGFDVKSGLLGILSSRVHSDIELGYTRVGSHRADVMVNFTGKADGQAFKEQATHVLSRGEKKLLIAVLKLSQLQMLCDKGVSAVVLIDDIDAELDKEARQTLLDILLTLPCQLFISSLSEEVVAMIQALGRNVRAVAVFDVKGGQALRRV